MCIILQVSKKYVSKELAKEIQTKAAPFVKWLKEAEEESGGSEEEEVEDDENVEVTVDHCMNLVSQVYVHLVATRLHFSQSKWLMVKKCKQQP